MTTATAETMPTAVELDRVLALVEKAANELDELHLKCYRLASDLDAGDGPPPTYEELGRLASFVVCVDQDLETAEQHMKDVRRALRAAGQYAQTDGR